MKVLLLFNPIAGSGRAGRAAQALATDLGRAGHEAVLAETTPDPREGWLDAPLRGADLLVVAGGDGAVRCACDPAVRLGTPVYHFPLGTENLFAREFGMSRSVARLLAAIDRFRVEPVDVGAANGRTFLLMASVGFDADVVHDLARRREGGIRHLSYLRPILRQLARWRPPRLSITVDGETLVDDAPGFAVVANSRQYAGRLDPAPRASMRDGRLDVVFFPARSGLDLVGWAVRCAGATHLGDARLRYRLGATATWRSADPVPYQVDGDAPVAADGGRTREVRVAVRPAALRVLRVVR